MVEVLGAYEETHKTCLHPINDLRGGPNKKGRGNFHPNPYHRQGNRSLPSIGVGELLIEGGR